MSGIDEDFKIEIAKHMGCVTSELKSLSGVVREFKDEQKQSREHNDIAVKELQIHFDGKIASCHEDVMTILKKRHLDKDEVRDKITKAIKASERRTYWKVAIFAAILSFLYEYSEAVINFLNMLRGK